MTIFITVLFLSTVPALSALVWAHQMATFFNVFGYGER